MLNIFSILFNLKCVYLNAVGLELGVFNTRLSFNKVSAWFEILLFAYLVCIQYGMINFLRIALLFGLCWLACIPSYCRLDNLLIASRMFLVVWFIKQ